MSNRSLIITFLIILALLLMALIGLLIYNIWQLRQAPPSSATVYLVDSSIRMAEPLGEGSTSRLEAAQQFVSQSAVRLPDTEVVSVHVFGSGASAIGCEDTLRLVQLDQENQTEIVEKITEISPISSDAALVKAAIEALEELVDSGFQGVVQLIIITGGDGTCNDDLEQIVRTANFYGLELETIIVPVNSNREPIVVNIPGILNAKEIIIDSAESIAEGVNLINASATQVVLVPPTLTPTFETPTPPILGSGTITATQTPILPTISPIPTSATTPTFTPTATEDAPVSSPTIPPLNASPTPDGTVTATNIPSLTPTNTNTPVPTVAPSSTPVPNPPTATNAPPANTATLAPPNPTTVPASPTSTIAPPPEPDSRISIFDVIVNESAGNAFVILRRADVNSKAVLVNYDTSNGTALAGLDYTATSGQVTWQANDGGDQTIIIPIVNDQLLETSESFNVILSNVVNAVIEDGTAIVTIQDNESGDILINPSSISVSESAGSTSSAITLNGAPQSPVSINLTSTDTDLCIPVGSVTLDSSNWDSGVPVGITIVDNPSTNDSGFTNCIIQTSASSSTDPSFNNVNPVDINVQIIDNDAIYVDHTCSDTDGNEICDDGIRFRTIQSAIDNGSLAGSSTLNIIVTTGPHTESGINVSRNITLSGPAGIVLRAAENTAASTDRIMSINLGVSATINSMTLENGNSGTGSGGAIINRGSLTLNNVIFQNNRTDTTGSGGAVATLGSLSISNSEFTTNTGGSCGGAVHIETSGTASILATDFTGNQAALGGAVCANGQLNLNGGNLSGNIASNNGGAVLINSAAESVIENAVLSNNRGVNGGAVFITDISSLRSGGSTYSFNQSTTGSGGAIHAAGGLTTFNVTVSGNQSGSGGAGIHRASGIVTLFNTTVAFNSSLGGNPSGLFGNMTLINTLVDSNSGGDCSGTFDAFFSLFGNIPAACTFTAGSNSNQLNQSAGLSNLGNNGGDTETHLPANPGPAINNGPPAGNQNCPAGGFDQRGTGRPQGPSCDIGSVEQ
ncbi:MAG: Calx-beta domain-containing protein [Anaerolineae bacterium]